MSALVTTVIDLHVRIAQQEADTEKAAADQRHLAAGRGPTFLILATVLGQLALVLWLHLDIGWGWIKAVLVGDLLLAGLFLRSGGQLIKGPYLPQTTAGLSRTTRALLGR